MRPIRDFRPQQLYGVTQRGNQGQWVYRDDQDFRKALDLMAKYAARLWWKRSPTVSFLE